MASDFKFAAVLIGMSKMIYCLLFISYDGHRGIFSPFGFLKEKTGKKRFKYKKARKLFILKYFEFKNTL